MIDFDRFPSPCYIMDEELLRKNLTLIKSVADRAGVELRCFFWKQIFFSDSDLKLVPPLRFLFQHRSVHKVQGIGFCRKLIDTVADGRQLTHYPVKFGVGFFAELIALYHFSKERFF